MTRGREIVIDLSLAAVLGVLAILALTVGCPGGGEPVPAAQDGDEPDDPEVASEPVADSDPVDEPEAE